MLQFNNLPDLLLAARVFFRANPSHHGAVAFLQEKYTFSFADLHNPEDFYLLSVGNVGTTLFTLSYDEINNLPTNLDLDNLEYWLHKQPPLFMTSLPPLSFSNIQTLFRGTLNQPVS